MFSLKALKYKGPNCSHNDKGNGKKKKQRKAEKRGGKKKQLCKIRVQQQKLKEFPCEWVPSCGMREGKAVPCREGLSRCSSGWMIAGLLQDPRSLNSVTQCGLGRMPCCHKAGGPQEERVTEREGTLPHPCPPPTPDIITLPAHPLSNESRPFPKHIYINLGS